MYTIECSVQQPEQTNSSLEIVVCPLSFKVKCIKDTVHERIFFLVNI